MFVVQNQNSIQALELCATFQLATGNIFISSCQLRDRPQFEGLRCFDVLSHKPTNFYNFDAPLLSSSSILTDQSFLLFWPYFSLQTYNLAAGNLMPRKITSKGGSVTISLFRRFLQDRDYSFGITVRVYKGEKLKLMKH